MATPTRRARLTAPLFSLVTASLLLWLAPVVVAQTPKTSDLELQASSVQLLGSGYLQVEGVMSGQVARDDGSEGRYRVPVTLVYPEDTARCGGEALVDVVNSVFYETFESAGTAQDPLFPSLLPAGRLLLGDGFLQSRGYVYAQAQWNKLVIERQREAGTLADPTLTIERGTDGYFVLRDLSDFLRRPAELFAGPVAPPCAAHDVVAFGGSQTAMLLRQFYFAGLNTALASASSFDDGKVFEGSLQLVPGGRCRALSDQRPWFSYSFAHCEGATPERQGKVITINSEGDLQIIGAWRARPDGGAGDYRVYEVAGAPHTPKPLIPLKLLGLRPPDAAEQNYVELAPVLRAMAVQLRGWLEAGSAPPPSVFVKGRVARLDAPFFSSTSWGSDARLAFVTTLGEDGNALGGVRLPHVRTALANGVRVGGPLGLYRGAECANDPSDSMYILHCGLSGDTNIYNMAGGTFTPYPQVDTRVCSALYPTHQAYTTAVTQAAEHAVAEGWILAEEVDAIVAAAEQKAVEYPGCVPGSGDGGLGQQIGEHS
jgi:hypothetical protein